MFGGFHEDSDSVGIPAMNFVVSLVHILLVALLQSSSVKTASINKEAEKSKNEVVSFNKVYEQSICQPRDVLVNVFQAYPEDTEHIYTPSCVVLKRCGGCCNDEGKECVPAESRNVTLQLQRFRPRVIKEVVDLSFTEHVLCVCRSKPDVLAEEKKKYQCAPCSERRKSLFVQDLLTCKCSCKFTQLDCKSRQLELNERTCRCDKPRR